MRGRAGRRGHAPNGDRASTSKVPRKRTARSPWILPDSGPLSTISRQPSEKAEAIDRSDGDDGILHDTSTSDNIKLISDLEAHTMNAVEDWQQEMKQVLPVWNAFGKSRSRPRRYADHLIQTSSTMRGTEVSMASGTSSMKEESMRPRCESGQVVFCAYNAHTK